MREAEFWHMGQDGSVECDLCPQRCSIAPGKAGRCRVRVSTGQCLNAASYGQVSSASVDPVEKKPLYHFYPGRPIFSIGGWGCNLTCSFCQNWSISQSGVQSRRMHTPEHMVEEALRSQSIGIAYTYNEPLINFEFVTDCVIKAKLAGLTNVLVTNGYINEHPAAQILPHIDALNIDIKSMDDSFYISHCGGRLQPVLSFATQAKRAGCHVEITNLVIPELNDGDQCITSLAQWIRNNLGAETPLHLSAYHPQHKLTTHATSLDALLHAHRLCRQHLSYVYLGNVATNTGQNTYCPSCESIVIARHGYVTEICGIEEGLCSKCGAKANVVRE